MIEESLYQLICKTVPLPTVDIILVCNGEILLVKRGKSPAYGLWWTIGGRQELGEIMEDTAKRKLQEEVGISDANIYGSIGSVDTIFEERHNVTSVILATITRKPLVKLDQNHVDYKWIKRKESDFHPYLVKILNYYFDGVRA
jgi:ADP-ribose pyrophosphatase YjhB (NUDIX family)